MIIVCLFQSEKYSPNTLWPKYSMLKTMLTLKNRNLPAKYFDMVESVIKNKNKGYQAKKSKVLTREELIRFMSEAPDDVFLLQKVYIVVHYCNLVYFNFSYYF